MDSQTSEPPSGPIVVPLEPMNVAGDDAVVTYQRGSAIRHLAILSTLLIPIAFIPYMVTRRQVTTLSRKIDEVGATTALLKRRLALGQAGPGMESESGAALLAQMRQEMEAMRQQFESKESQRTKYLSDMTLHVNLINEELDKVKGDVLGNAPNPRLANVETGLRNLEDGVDNIRQQIGTQALDVQEQIRLLRGEQEALRSELFKLSDEVQSVKTGPQNSELQKLLVETKQTRAIFGAIGSSLGDVATIIQRVEIEMGHERSAGYDPVERLRVLALQMQDQTFRVEKKERRR
ncbi:hypothetical protein C8F04DRAFT_15113 [Mycena alexandri]|uniref:Uncharacterized protein n=1 Tax=Mycena alexandri TaxID=1745969 RepID=A0AAD6TNX9_9AGAR|nr:hypothetical protein C8F04DRAFT_15113 [Mycena alexandri]